MKQYKDEVGELNDAARQRPHSVLIAGIQQENRHLRELQQENRELRAALEEHQNALELIMSKYRQQMTQLVNNSKQNFHTLYNQQYTQVIEKQADKITEMAAVMKMAAAVDDNNGIKDEATIVQLTTENKGLRELLDISVKFGSTTDADKKEKLSEDLTNKEAET
uniref:FGFR1 oncogene partner 2 homolog n=1 Tax=Cuerna arida TaxID=1464854 RepID=A0A1B6G2J8_9HEMI